MQFLHGLSLTERTKIGIAQAFSIKNTNMDALSKRTPILANWIV